MSIGISSFLSPSAVVLDLRATDKTSLLHELSRRAVGIARLPRETVFAELDKRERLGSTGIGDGIAIPHAKYAGLTETIGLVARLKPALDFDAVDGRPVDLVFLLLAPASSACLVWLIVHLSTPARVHVRRNIVGDKSQLAPVRIPEHRKR